MMRNLLVRGMLTGLAGAVLALIFAWTFGESQIEHAITFEGRMAQAAGETPQPEVVSRTVQSTLGLAAGIGLFGVAFGGVFAVAFGFAYGRIGRFGPRATAGMVALGAFVTVEAVPFLKYPANPPSVGDPASLGQRTTLYWAVILIAIVAAIGAVLFGRRFAPLLGNWNATLLAAGAFLGGVAIIYTALPTVDEVPRDFPAVVLWRFRIASLGIHAILWTTIGLLFGALTERSLTRRSQPSPEAPAAIG
jgi:hypothetical protein